MSIIQDPFLDPRLGFPTALRTAAPFLLLPYLSPLTLVHEMQAYFHMQS